MADATVHGVRLHYQRLGTPGASPRVVFLHGLVMDNLASWYFSVANAVATFADVLLYDLRGHGLSERPPAGYRLDDMVQDLDELLVATLGEGPALLVGNSFGALLAVSFALRFPERVAGLVLVDGHLGDVGFAQQMTDTLSLRGEAADLQIAESFKHWLGRHSERKRTRLTEHARSLVLETSLVKDLQATPPLAASDFARLQPRTLALYGERSDLLERSAPLVASIRNSTLEIVPGCTHSILWEATNDVRAKIVGFCRELG
jgi:pimeloyl-ACP methyl ester carboxylesterase